jgi:hypothetical protein
LLSLHDEWLSACWQPKPASQESVVQSTPSSQFGGVPGWHAPCAVQVSSPLQALLSLHEFAVLGTNEQPVAATHESFVHGLLSLQTKGTPAMQVPPEQDSCPLQAFRSPQPLLLFGVNTHPVAGLQVSSVHGLLSLHTRGAPVQVPFPHVSLIVHALLSLHALVLGTPHWPLPLQTSLVHTLPSLVQGVPCGDRHESVASMQVFWHTGPFAHGLPDETQPLTALHVSVPLQNRVSAHAP